MIADIRLQNFRSYVDASFSFSSGVNIIAGPNGSGKTNLLEALLVLARGSSYRVHDAELIHFDATWARLDAQLLQPDTATRTLKIATEPKPLKTYEINGRVYRRLTLQHLLPVVLFEPNDLQLLHGAPDLRRAYLDDMLEQTYPGFASFRRNYRRLLAQRNTLLKRTHQPSSGELFPWNLRLSELGATIARARHELVKAIARDIPELYAELSGSNSQVAIHYKHTFPMEHYETHMMQRLEEHLVQDIARGFTTYGPHREDFTVTYDERAADEVASRGETRTAVLALKILELQLLEARRNQTPLLLLDDVFSELDATRRHALTGFLQRYQTFLTTTDADLLDGGFVGSQIIAL